MSLPTSLRAYEDCRKLFEAAAADAKGARALTGTYDSAVHLRSRMHYFRSLDRKANAEVYKPGHPMHGQSLYDVFVVQIIPDEDGQYWLYITSRASQILLIENLSEVDDLIESEGHEVHMIEDKSNG